jgi:HAD superfamily hydrolase (TIGR01509 family)
MIRGVLFDYSGTLFRFEPEDGWTDEAVTGIDPVVLTALLTSPVTPANVPADLHEDWARRDLDLDIHRRVYLAALGSAHPEVPATALTAIYERLLHPTSWRPYPDTLEVLNLLRGNEIPVGVVSNIPWDIRDVFERNGMFNLVDEFVLSYAEGVMKPDPKIFLTACQRIGVAPSDVLMVGDSEHADGGAIGVGCRFAAVAAIPVDERPDALRTALGTHGL